MDLFPLLITIASAVGWWSVAQKEDASPVVWAGLSILLNLGAQAGFGSLLAMVLSQGLLFVGIAAWRVWREDRDRNR